MKLKAMLTDLDRQATETWHMPSLLLMEAAGRAVADAVESQLAKMQGIKQPKVVIVCGPGNNGGDGFVCARHLAQHENVSIFVLHTEAPEDLHGDPKTNFAMLAAWPITVQSAQNIETAYAWLAQADVIVDALLGSGLSRDITGPTADLIQQINQSPARRVAIDLPSGLAAKTGSILGVAVQANLTVTFALAKPGLYLHQGPAYAGKINVVDIGMPPSVMAEATADATLITPALAQTWMPPRHGFSHKYQYGRVLVIAGSRYMAGAAIMASQAALKAGAGLVVLAAPSSVLTSQALPPELLTHPLPESPEGSLVPEAMAALAEQWAKATTVAVGPGLTQSPSTVGFLNALLPYLAQTFTGIVVLDADALNALSQVTPRPALSSRIILTPHLGECARLIGWESKAIQADLMAASREVVQQYHATIVLKSASTVVQDGEQRVWINATGNSGMATAGSGDILTGLIAGLAAQGISADAAAKLGVYLHGKAGDYAAAALTPYCLTATDLLTYLPQAIQETSWTSST